MKQLVMTVLLLVVIVLIYSETIGGESGARAAIRRGDSGGQDVGASIRGLDP